MRFKEFGNLNLEGHATSLDSCFLRPTAGFPWPMLFGTYMWPWVLPFTTTPFSLTSSDDYKEGRGFGSIVKTTLKYLHGYIKSLSSSYWLWFVYSLPHKQVIKLRNLKLMAFCLGIYRSAQAFSVRSESWITLCVLQLIRNLPWRGTFRALYSPSSLYPSLPIARPFICLFICFVFTLIERGLKHRTI